LVFVTRDEGRSWTKVTPPGMPDLGRVSLIDASPHKASAAYVAVKNYLQEDRAPYIFRTDDFGKTWTKIVNGLKPGDYVHAVREDPKRPGLLYAGTEHGIYVSFDNGDHWQTLSLNLPDTQVSDIVVEAHDLVIATHGRSMYVLDDIDVLRQISAETAASTIHLFQPREVIRSLNQAAFYYYLKQPAEKVTIDILDAKGQQIRTFTSVRADEQKQETRRPEAGSEDSDFGPPPSRLRLECGPDKIHLEPALSGRDSFSGHDPLERECGFGTGSGARQLSSAADCRRTCRDRSLDDQDGSAPQWGDGKRFAGAVRFRDEDSR
jgi:hypothetical protein